MVSIGNYQFKEVFEKISMEKLEFSERNVVRIFLLEI
jgi:hypothetical protein